MKVSAVKSVSIDYLDKEITKHILESSKELLKNKKFISSVWPAATAAGAENFFKNKPSYLTLLPLHRVGAPEGASGAKVMVAYFNNESPLWCSKPLILKFEKVESGEDEKLFEENSNFKKIEPFVREFESTFAAPIYLSRHDNYRILWSPFLSRVFSVDKRSEGMQPEENDLWKFLTNTVKPIDEKDKFKKHEDELEKLFNAIYNYLRPMHDRFGMAGSEAEELGVLYAKYLRNYSKWINRWELIWGNKKNIKGSRVSVNPIYVFKELISKVFNVRTGAVHGDLHPKNVLLDNFERPQIIDFGWSTDKAHVLVDFALMEANLRFVTLHNPVPEAQLDALTRLLTLEDLTSSAVINSDYLNFIRESIINVRKKAKMIYSDPTTFENEYAISLFLISFGLLKFIESFKNQSATQRTVETLAQHVYELLLRK